MKKSDLYREWARVMDMCEGTNAKPEYCWKLGGWYMGEIPDFGAPPKGYTFAVAILEDKPVFFGDKVYSKLLGEEFDWSDRDYIRQITCDNFPVSPNDVWTLIQPKIKEKKHTSLNV